MGISSDTDSAQDSQQGSEERGATVEIPSPFNNEVESFNNTVMFPDLTFVVSGLGEPLHLHKKTLASASLFLKESMTNASAEKEFVWPFDTSSATDRNALLKALRFCYGQSMSIGYREGECWAVIAARKRLKVTCLESVAEQLEGFVTNEAHKSLATAISMLNECMRYRECCGDGLMAFNWTLAGIVLTAQNITEHFQEVVVDCLMTLPPEYLDHTQYGAPHTPLSEFSLRAMYVERHPKMSAEEKAAVIGECDWKTLSAQELHALALIDIIDKGALLEAYYSLLVRTESVAERDAKHVAQLEKERDEFRNRALRAEEALEDQNLRFRSFQMHTL